MKIPNVGRQFIKTVQDVLIKETKINLIKNQIKILQTGHSLV